MFQWEAPRFAHPSRDEMGSCPIPDLNFLEWPMSCLSLLA